MNSSIKLLILVLIFSCSKDKNEPFKPFDVRLVASWQLVSVTTNAGSVTTNPTDREIITRILPDTNIILFSNNTSMGVGRYNRLSENGVNILVYRSDRGGWPNGPWLDLYLENMNKASSYIVKETELKIKTSENSTLLFYKQ